MIRYLKRNAINDAQWNDCVRQSTDGLPYGYTWYLDSVCEQWDGLVIGDYETVFPAVWRQRFFVRYLYQPMFTQQLGGFSKNPPDENTLKLLLDEIANRFKFIEINLNFRNPVQHPMYKTTSRTNLCLNLKDEYEALAKNYSDNAKRNLSKSQKQNLFVNEEIETETVIEFFKTNTGTKIPALGEYHYAHLHKLIEAAKKYGMCRLTGVWDNDNFLHAAGFFLVDQNKIINLLPSTGEEGKEIGAGFLLMDETIRHFAGREMTLDFEGSMIASIARFYKGFGAQEQTYWHIRRNNLPLWIRWIKN